MHRDANIIVCFNPVLYSVDFFTGKTDDWG